MKKVKKKTVITPWQEVITRWKRWARSTDEAKKAVISKYGEQTPILLAENSEPLYQLIDEVSDMGYEFVIGEIGLKPESEYFEDFLYTWMHSVLDEITDEYNRHFTMVGELAEREKMWVSNRRENRKGEIVVVSSINWIKGAVGRGELLKKMQDKNWLSL